MAKRELIEESVWPEITYIADRVAELRKEKGMSQQDLMNVTGLTQAYISTVEKRMANPSAMVLAQLARGLGVPMAELVMPTMPKSAKGKR